MRFEGRRVERAQRAQRKKPPENDFDAVFWPFSNAACCSLAIKNDKKRRQSRFLKWRVGPFLHGAPQIACYMLLCCLSGIPPLDYVHRVTQEKCAILGYEAI